ncbi:hypothetical protein ACFV9C_44475 [Kribbella sp. NPDC059898]|uniref:hypothetical protein n=1 Tax=Kribbella sp. NPDC059898 TaxID=3346995 RepID=UPI00364B31B2
MSHHTPGNVLAFPAPRPQPRGIDAAEVFGHRVRPGHRGWLWTVEVDGIEYLTDRLVVIRTDRLDGLDGERFDALEFAPKNAARLLEALAAPLAGVPATTRFEVDVIAALYAVGAGILPLAGDRVPDLHAVIYGGERIGLVTPLPSFRADYALGAIPGVPPGPIAVDQLEAAR